MKQNKPVQTVTADVHPLHGRSLMHNGARAETRRKGFSECLLGTDISILPYFNLRVFSWSKLHFEAPRFWEAIEDIRVKDEWPHWWPTPNLIVGEKIDEERWKMLMVMVMVMEHNQTRLKRHQNVTLNSKRLKTYGKRHEGGDEGRAHDWHAGFNYYGDIGWPCIWPMSDMLSQRPIARLNKQWIAKGSSKYRGICSELPSSEFEPYEISYLWKKE